MSWKSILEAYEEYNTHYYMNNQMLLDNMDDYKVAEAIATKEAIEIERK